MKILAILESDDLFDNLPADDLNSLIQKREALSHHSNSLQASFDMLVVKYANFGGVKTIVYAVGDRAQQYLDKGFKRLERVNSIVMYRDIPELKPVISRMTTIGRAIGATEFKLKLTDIEIVKLQQEP